jgi:hypothetical protein
MVKHGLIKERRQLLESFLWKVWSIEIVGIRAYDLSESVPRRNSADQDARLVLDERQRSTLIFACNGRKDTSVWRAVGAPIAPCSVDAWPSLAQASAVSLSWSILKVRAAPVMMHSRSTQCCMFMVAARPCNLVTEGYSRTKPTVKVGQPMQTLLLKV